MNSCASIVILISDLSGGADGLDSFHALRFLADVHVNVVAGIEDKAVALVHRADGHVHLLDADVLLALNLEQSLLTSGVDFNLVESTGNAAWHVTDTVLEVIQEKLAFVVLDFAMLDRPTAELVIELNGADGSGARFVQAGFMSQPEMNVPRQSLALGFHGLFSGNIADQLRPLCKSQTEQIKLNFANDPSCGVMGKFILINSSGEIK